MKRLIAAVLTATTMTLASCTAITATEPSTTSDPATNTAGTTAPTTAGSTTPDPIESWLNGTTTTSSSPTSTSTTGTTVSSTAPSTTVTGDVYDAIPVTIPATITGADLKIANQAVSVWRNAMRVFDQSLQDPGGKDWKTTIYQYANDPAALKQMSLINTFIKQGIHQVGEAGYTAEVLSAVKHNVQIKTCVDLSKYNVIDGQGESVLKPDVVSRFSRTFSISFYYGEKPELWFLNDITTPNPPESC
ncbi:MAG: hypothetical protein BGO26_06620 [Actinobacteria bacterium 69-20]|nr:hypothetical protein [Actinomycetota bacterium]OJV28108.1 MAG: hypothetical protein BGO26_06620 [Actinobacteria bacterium 69-20]